MGNRYMDWLRQAEADLRHARHALETGGFEWSCFAAQQAAEKALKAVCQKSSMDAWEHTLTTLIGNLPPPAHPTKRLIDRAKMLDKHYIPTRYPNGFESEVPTDFYTEQEARDAIEYAEEILAFCRDQVV